MNAADFAIDAKPDGKEEYIMPIAILILHHSLVYPIKIASADFNKFKNP